MATDITLNVYLWNINKGKLLDPDPVEIKVNPKMQLCQFIVNISRKTGIDKLDKEISISTLDSEKRIILPSPYNVKRTFEFNEITHGTDIAVTLYSPQKPSLISLPKESPMVDVSPKSETKPTTFLGDRRSPESSRKSITSSTKKTYQKNPMLDQLGAYFAQSVYLSAPDPSELPDPTGLFDD